MIPPAYNGNKLYPGLHPVQWQYPCVRMHFLPTIFDFLHCWEAVSCLQWRIWSDVHQFQNSNQMILSHNECEEQFATMVFCSCAPNRLETPRSTHFISHQFYYSYVPNVIGVLQFCKSEEREFLTRVHKNQDMPRFFSDPFQSCTPYVYVVSQHSG